ncbi:heparan-alpha-glucosaminide N-acetyltransferase [Xylophilus sp. ASV27]|uniref:heparan-alpha-glucosaminide N-acetyltransferase n=1 Tax=Xylophilus sp. ASV27 TaxID=2795129 RepID=UPI0018EB69EF|nr:heparan-alpha-glucosaminide N-acetyltransferase [Xylophilus sp. ASV27]
MISLSSAGPARGPRAGAVDALRGAAVVWMTAFHFCFDLSFHGFWRQNFLGDPLWTLQRTAIVSLFVFCAGLGQALAVGQGQDWARFWRRWRQVAGCALLVTAGSWWLFPRSFIYFGVLHGLAVMLVVARLTAGAGAGRWLWPLGALAVASPWLAGALLQDGALAPLFNGPALNWLGWITRKPVTEDYVPVFPWLGVLWWGMAAGHWAQRRRPHWLALGQGHAALRPLAWLGRHSLPWYMLHQPVLLGALALLSAWLHGG